ncbi:MAG TPA: hypothetical protein VFC51_01865 [Chloroflexota bacterium]|nr:hypothetical protein [Chloroflexota bacterium]
MLNDVMRFTVIDGEGAVSFVAPCRTMEALVAACASEPGSLLQLLNTASQFAPEVRDHVLSGLAVFDEHNVPGRLESIHSALDLLRPADLPVFRVLDDRTRQASLQPARAGVIVFNLKSKRIVQIHNTYAEIKRSGRIRVPPLEGANARPPRIHRYELPADWSLVPGVD